MNRKVDQLTQDVAEPIFSDSQSGLNYKHDRIAEEIVKKLRSSSLCVSEGLEILERVKNHIGSKRI